MKIIRRMIIAVLIVFISFAAIYSTSSDYTVENYERRTTTDNGETVTETIDPKNFTDDYELELNMAKDFAIVKKANADIQGWINIPNVGYFPIMQASDNKYYLNHNEYGEYTTKGAPFLDYECDGMHDVMYIYGHNWVKGEMFGSLRKYKEEDFFYGNDVVTVYNGKTFYYYKPFTVFLFTTNKFTVQLEFSSLEERATYMQSLADKSKYNVELKTLLFKPLFLQTCDYDFHNARLEVGFYVDTVKSFEDILEEINGSE